MRTFGGVDDKISALSFNGVGRAVEGDEEEVVEEGEGERWGSSACWIGAWKRGEGFPFGMRGEKTVEGESAGVTL